MLSSRKKRMMQKGGSNASARVEQLSATKCCANHPLRYPEPVKCVMTNSFRNKNLGASYKIMSGGGRSKTSNNWFVSNFLPEIVNNVELGNSPSKIVQVMVKKWNANHSKKYHITKKIGTQMLYDFADANRKHKGGDIVIPLRWITNNKSSKKIKQRGGANQSCPTNQSTLPYNNQSCPTNQSTLPYNYDNYWRPRENSSNASIPRNMFQKTDDWYNGSTTIFTPSYGEITNHAGVNYKCNSSDCSGSSVPKLENATTTLADPTASFVPNSGAPTPSEFKLFSEPVVDNAPNKYILPLSRAGSRRKTKRVRRRKK
jgi:hypothetical protein